jgi:hypothetical protein
VTFIAFWGALRVVVGAFAAQGGLPTGLERLGPISPKLDFTHSPLYIQDATLLGFHCEMPYCC